MSQMTDSVKSGVIQQVIHSQCGVYPFHDLRLVDGPAFERFAYRLSIIYITVITKLYRII